MEPSFTINSDATKSHEQHPLEDHNYSAPPSLNRILQRIFKAKEFPQAQDHTGEQQHMKQSIGNLELEPNLSVKCQPIVAFDHVNRSHKFNDNANDNKAYQFGRRQSFHAQHYWGELPNWNTSSWDRKGKKARVGTVLDDHDYLSTVDNIPNPFRQSAARRDFTKQVPRVELPEFPTQLSRSPSYSHYQTDLSPSPCSYWRQSLIQRPEGDGYLTTRPTRETIPRRRDPAYWSPKKQQNYTPVVTCWKKENKEVMKQMNQVSFYESSGADTKKQTPVLDLEVGKPTQRKRHSCPPMQNC
ncbi:unnamed protein product [Orchesella dallaii]|uniref:Uncharacterized protein n=1 Tax=Orchesella dallaii TaxID=48710 RepID=A0ABP1PMB7_9HEXA